MLSDSPSAEADGSSAIGPGTTAIRSRALGDVTHPRKSTLSFMLGAVWLLAAGYVLLFGLAFSFGRTVARDPSEGLGSD